MKHILSAGAVALAAFAAAPAMAVQPVPTAQTSNGDCAANPGVFASPFTFIACSGSYDGNSLSNNAGDVLTQKAALTELGFDTTGFDFNSYFKISSLNGGDVTSPPAPTMYGITIFGIHFGNAQNNPLGNSTTYYKFDAGDGTTTIPFAVNGSSGWVLYDTGTPGEVVPEPATWAMLIAGFGLVGGAMRRRRGMAHVNA
jgi:hypothetical protein